jgi:hypothetical protein
MSTAHFYLPGFWDASSVRTVRPRDVTALCVAIAACCASIVFALLFNSDQRYPVAAVHETSPVNLYHPATVPLTRALSSATVARNHGELLAMERQGQRNYIEFSLPRSSSFEPVGPIELGVWRVDTLHEAIQASVLLGSTRLDFKRIGMNERVLVPIAHDQVLEVVVNRATKNQVSGYVSEPRNVSWELARNSNTAVPAVR